MKHNTTEARAEEHVRQFLSLLADEGPQVVSPDAPLVASLRTLLRVIRSERTGA